MANFIPRSVAGGRSYDAFVAHVLHAYGVQAAATFNAKHFAGLIDGFTLIDPGAPATA